ncbi:efflux RND transporter permease subunit [Bacillus kexueae]|uniref:efflux RND transporter permease subunit n=1 Tax=Aeribacillus kexueae TaxID=2078952 RepID=UPI001FAFD391|nr:efflux RND transporter permease subunit [Bacillus kexueae]
MKFLTRFSLKNTIAISILTILVLVGGLFSSQSIKVETFPDVTFPGLMVQTVYPNASTEEIEESVTDPLEEALMNLEDYDAISSTSSENISFINVTFSFDQDVDEMKTEVESLINQVALPDDAEVSVETFSPNDTPVYQVAVSAEDFSSLQEDLLDRIVPDLEATEGVASVNVTGVEEQNIVIVVDEEEAAKYGLNLSTIQEAIEAKEYKIPVGTWDHNGNSIPLQMKGNLADVEAIESIEIPLQSQVQMMPNAPQSQQLGPAVVKLSDIANVEVETSRTEISRFNGEDSVLIGVQKAPDANTVDVVTKAKELLDEKTEGKDYEFYTVFDQGQEVEKSISALLKEGGYGALFTVIVILLFLRNVRATIIAIISLPVSILGTISLLDYFNYTLNIMTLGGMAVAVGRIVDDSIVVIENIYRWKQQHPNMSHKKLVFEATKEVMGPITSSTIATLIVFLPLALVGGILGEFFRPFSLAVVFSITISLLVSVMLIPVLGNTFFKKVKHVEKTNKGYGFYKNFLKRSMKKKGIVFTLAIALLVGSVGVVPFLGVTFLPTGESKVFQAELTLPNDVTLVQTNELATEIEEHLTSQEDVAFSQVTIGIPSMNQMPGTLAKTDENIARFTIELEEGVSFNDSMKTFEEEILAIAQKQYADATIKVEEIQQEGPPGGNTIELQLYSDDLEQLRTASKQVEELLAEDTRLKNVLNNMEETDEKFVFTLNEEGERLQVSPFQIVSVVNDRITEVDGGTLTLTDGEWDVTIKYNETLDSKEELEELPISTIEGVKELKEVVTIETEETPLSIKHQDGKTAATVSATIIGNDTTKVTSEVMKEIDSLTLPRDVEYESTGGMEMITDGFQDLGLAMLAAIFLVFIVLSVTFGGFVSPMVILSSLIFVPIGSLTALLITGQPLSMSGMIGMLMLIGIVVTNAVVLLDRVESNRKQGLPLEDAIVEASVTRLRPILMTAMATIFALIPLAMSNESTGLISKGLAITVIGGLTTSTLLTLIFIPVLYHAVGKKRKLDTEEL